MRLFLSQSNSCVSFIVRLGLFGEGPAERRERLKLLVSKLSDDEIARKLKKKEEQEKREEEIQNVIFSHILFKQNSNLKIPNCVD